MDENGQSINIYELNALYKSFPPFSEWQQTSFSTTRWEKYTATLEEKKIKYSGLMSKALQTIETATAIDTGALEGLYETDRGFTFSVAAEGALWQTVFEEKRGHQATELVKAQLEAYEYVLDLATQKEPLTQARVRELHGIICRNQEEYQTYNQFGQLQNVPLEKGKYKIHPNHPRRSDGTVHAYAPVEVTPMEMQKLTDELQSDVFQEAHPVLQASYAHYAFVCIHPFADGNGRVARALAAVYTYRAASVPLLILIEKRRAYLDALEAADRGNFAAFADFILECYLDTMKLVEDSIKTAQTLAANESLKSLEALSYTKDNISQEQMDEAAQTLLSIVQEELKRVSTSNSSSHLKVMVVNSLGRVSPSDNYRVPQQQNESAPVVTIHLQTTKLLSNTTLRSSVYCEIPINDSTGDDIIVFAQNEKSFPEKTEVMSVRASELVPDISPSLKTRVKIRVEGIWNDLVKELLENAQKANGNKK